MIILFECCKTVVCAMWDKTKSNGTGVSGNWGLGNGEKKLDLYKKLCSIEFQIKVTKYQ